MSCNFKIIENKLKTFCSTLQKTIRAAKTLYYQRVFERYKSDIRKTWATINKLITKKSKKDEFPKYFIDKDKIITNEKDIAECLNSFFINVGPNLSKTIPAPANKSYLDYLKTKVALSFEFKSIEPQQLLKVIHGLKSKTSHGHDHISSLLLKEISIETHMVITLIINQSLATGIFPNNLKIAKVKPIFKKDNPHIPDNYRPISLLPAVSKLFEKVVFIQLFDYMVNNGLLYKSQYGFRTLHSTELAALELTDKIYLQLDKQKIPLAIFLDLSKAFDTIDHTILINKLRYYGIKGTPLNWFASYLSNRFQYVEYKDQSSSLRKITTGVPQGSILGPLLFIIYMNDIHTVTDKFNFILYADDTSLVEPLCTFNFPLENNIAKLSESINQELDAVTEWLALNKLSLNVKKTKIMLFHYRQRNITNLIPNLKMKPHLGKSLNLGGSKYYKNYKRTKISPELTPPLKCDI